jgi:hypothetical protein
MANKWLNARIEAKKKNDGSDFHSSLANSKEERLLDTIYENSLWWKEIASVNKKHSLFWLLLSLAGLFLIIFCLAFIEIKPPTNLKLLNNWFQISIAFLSAGLLQEYEKWRDTEQEMAKACHRMENLVRNDTEEEGKLHLMAADYYQQVSRVAPAPSKIVDSIFNETDDRVIAVLKKREDDRNPKT